MNRMLISATLTALLVTPAFAGDSPCSKPAAATKTLVETAIGAGQFTTLVKAVQAAGLVETLSGPGPFTVFAPNDAAFAKLPAGALSGLVADKAALGKVLTYHVVAGRVSGADASKLSFAKTVNGQSLQVTFGEGELRVDGAKVIVADIQCSNGVIHVIDTVVMPRKDLVDTAIGAGSFKTLVAAVQAAGLVDTLRSEGPFTVFAPTDAAFSALPAGTVEGLLKDIPTLQSILKYHVVSGRVLSGQIPAGTTEVTTVEGRKLTVVKAADGSVTVNGAKVVSADILTANGVIHVIDAVALPK